MEFFFFFFFLLPKQPNTEYMYFARNVFFRA